MRAFPPTSLSVRGSHVDDTTPMVSIAKGSAPDEVARVKRNRFRQPLYTNSLPRAQPALEPAGESLPVEILNFLSRIAPWSPPSSMRALASEDVGQVILHALSNRLTIVYIYKYIYIYEAYNGSLVYMAVGRTLRI